MRFATIICSFLPLIISLHNTASAETYRQKELNFCNPKSLSLSVQKASHTLSLMKASYRLSLKKHLHILKMEKGWNQKELINNARPLLHNVTISKYEEQNKALVSSIEKLNPSGKTVIADCKLLIQLNSRLRKIIENNRDKWKYMLLQIKQASQNSQ